MKLKITTKGFDDYMYKIADEKFFDIYDVHSEKELLQRIRKCVKGESK